MHRATGTDVEAARSPTAATCCWPRLLHNTLHTATGAVEYPPQQKRRRRHRQAVRPVAAAGRRGPRGAHICAHGPPIHSPPRQTVLHPPPTPPPVESHTPSTALPPSASPTPSPSPAPSTNHPHPKRGTLHARLCRPSHTQPPPHCKRSYLVPPTAPRLPYQMPRWPLWPCSHRILPLLPKKGPLLRRRHPASTAVCTPRPVQPVQPSTRPSLRVLPTFCCLPCSLPCYRAATTVCSLFPFSSGHLHLLRCFGPRQNRCRAVPPPRPREPRRQTRQTRGSDRREGRGKEEGRKRERAGRGREGEQKAVDRDTREIRQTE